MSVTVRTRINSDGTTSLRFDINHNGKRWVETLQNVKLITRPSKPDQRKQNKDSMALAEEIAHERATQLDAGEHDVEIPNSKKVLAVDWMQSYIDSYKKKDKRNMQGALNRFKSFLKERGIKGLSFGGLKEHHVIGFQDYLLEHSIGEGAASYFARFKKMLKRAKQEKIIKFSPATDVKTKRAKARKKDILTLEEIKLLAATPTESNEVRRAFLLSCLSGLRWIDVKGLDWKNIQGTTVSVRQSKTDEDVAIPLNDSAVKLLGERGQGKVFNLPSANGANKTVKAWIKRAGIIKAITWHNARHSFGTNLIFNDVDVLTTSKLLGHASLKHTLRYLDVAREMKETATNKLNIL